MAKEKTEKTEKSLYEIKGEITGTPLDVGRGEIEEEPVELTNDDNHLPIIIEGGVNVLTVNKIILETAQAIEGRLSKTLGNQINDMIKPLKQSRIEYLEQELNVANFIMMEIQETYLGMFLLKRIHKKIRLDAEEKEKKKEKKQEESSDVKKN